MIVRIERVSLSPFLFNDPATTEIYTLSLHDALPICIDQLAILEHIGLLLRDADDHPDTALRIGRRRLGRRQRLLPCARLLRSEEHTSELQSRQYLVCRLLLEKKTIKPISRMPSSVLK